MSKEGRDRREQRPKENKDVTPKKDMDIRKETDALQPDGNFCKYPLIFYLFRCNKVIIL